MVKFVMLFLAVLISMTSSQAQDLTQERIWKIAGRKKSIFLDSGVFHKNSELKSSHIVGLRSSHPKGRGYERMVVDFNTKIVPKIYGHIKPHKKLTVDFFNTSIAAAQPQIKNSKYIKSVNFINVDTKSITMEINLKDKASFDIFYLENPGRFVIDIR